MTLIALCYNHVGQLECYADSRITRPDDGSVLTDNVAKILRLELRAYHLRSDERYRCTSSHAVGFAFSGSTIAALTTYSFLAGCTSSLACGDESNDMAEFPAMVDVAELARKIAEHVIRDINVRQLTSKKYMFRALLFGFCKVERTFKVFDIIPAVGPSFRMDVKQRDLLTENARGETPVHVIGDGAREFFDLFNGPDMPGAHVMAFFNKIITENVKPSVGGGIQIGCATRKGFAHLITVRHQNDVDTPLFLGEDINTFGPVGKFRIGFQGMRLDVEE